MDALHSLETTVEIRVLAWQGKSIKEGVAEVPSRNRCLLLLVLSIFQFRMTVTVSSTFVPRITVTL